MRPSVSILAEDSHALSRFVTEQLDDLLREPGYAAKFIDYGFDAHEPDRSIFDFASLEEYERELARLDLRTFKGERVKSQEELRLANFLTRNGIEYRYEEPFPVDTATQERRQYRPDFTILRERTGAGPLFLEHFGIDETRQSATVLRRGVGPELPGADRLEAGAVPAGAAAAGRDLLL